MSRTLSLICIDCEVEAWVGQSSSAGWYIYFADPKAMAMMDRFVNAHLGHHVQFDDSVDCLYEVFEDEQK